MPKKAVQKSEQLSLQMPFTDDYSLAESKPYSRKIFKSGVCQPAYVRENGLLFTDDSLQWLRTLNDSSVDLIFADPPYNINKADWDKFDSQEKYIQWSINFYTIV